MPDVYRCHFPGFDPLVRLRLGDAGCAPERWNSTEHPLRPSMPWTPGAAFSDVAAACFWPCAAELDVRRERWAADPWALGLVALGLALALASRPLARARWAWVLLAAAASVLFSVVLVGYATSRLWRNELSYSGVGTLTAAQVLLGFVAQRTWGWAEDHAHWVLLYVAAFGTLGLALGRGFVPEDVDPRAAAALETLLAAAALALFVVAQPSPAVALALGAGAAALKILAVDRRDDRWGRALTEATTRREVDKLLQSREFQKWLQRNHARVRVLR